jgi:formate dehydrogenase accessory protein FdhE
MRRGGEPVPESEKDTGWDGSGDVTARLQALIGQPHVSEAYVRFRLDMLAAQRAARSALADTVPASSGSDRATAPVPLNRTDVAFPAGILATLFNAMSASAARHGQETADLQRLSAGVATDPERLQTLAAAAAFEPDLVALESLAREWGVLVDALLFVGRALAAPCVAEAVRARTVDGGKRIVEAATHRCPACGSAPSVARLRRADGRRVLTCGLCGSEWEAVRLACACCGTLEQAQLGVLRLGDANARWVETCEGCKGYIKTVDERRLPEGEVVLPIVEESATLHLDLLAEREGYIRRVPYVMPG